MKAFQEVFPQFKAEGHLSALLNLLKVERVTVADDYSRLTIHVSCPRLIERGLFRELERGMERQLFPNKRLAVRICEHFTLSGSFTPETVFDAYKESILSELRSKSLIAFRILNRADITFPAEHVMELTVEDMPLNRKVLGELKQFLAGPLRDRRGDPHQLCAL